MKREIVKLFVLPAMVCVLGLGGCAGLKKEDRDLLNSAIKASEDCKAAATSAADSAKKAEAAASAAQSAANKAADAAARAEAAAAKMERIFEKSLRK